MTAIIRNRVRFSWLSALALVAAPIAAPAAAGLKAGDAFPDLATFALEGDIPAIAKGQIVVVDFWASWCGSCKKTFPLLEELHHRFGKQGLVILAVNEDKSRVAMNEFLKDNPVTFSVVRDSKKKLAAAVNMPALPTSYVLNGDGKIHSIQSGASIARNRRQFIQEIEELLEKNSKKP